MLLTLVKYNQNFKRFFGNSFFIPFNETDFFGFEIYLESYKLIVKHKNILKTLFQLKNIKNKENLTDFKVQI